MHTNTLNYNNGIHVNTNINSYVRKLGTKIGDARRASPGGRESLLAVQRKQDGATCFGVDLQQHEKIAS